MVETRQEDGQGCKDLEAEWRNFNSSADRAVPADSTDSGSRGSAWPRLTESRSKTREGGELDEIMIDVYVLGKERKVHLIINIKITFMKYI